MQKNLEQKCIDTLRLLGAEMITKAKSGHPGIVLGAAPIVHSLYSNHIRIFSGEANWFNRDRFILSAGHGSALLYSILHFAGFLSIDDLKNFRQKNSITPGHPEVGFTPGIEVSTGPLGQGVAMSVGEAIAEAHLAAKFNKPEYNIVDHHTYVLCGDGDLQEGIATEAMSLAGHLGLNKLIVLYDSNDIQLDGEVSHAMSENMKVKMEALHWDYLKVEDGNDLEALNNAINEAKKNKRPTLIEIKTIIGYGAAAQGESSVHGKPLTEEEVVILRQNLGYDVPAFEVLDEVNDYYNQNIVARGEKAYLDWNVLVSNYAKKFPSEYEMLNHYMFEDYSINDTTDMPSYNVGDSVSTRVVMGKVLDWMGKKLPNLIGGSADLSSSTMVKGADGIFNSVNRLGRDIKFGVREHAMAAIINGIQLHGGLKSFCAGFFVFSDYLKPAVRLAAIMRIPTMFFFSHDTVCVGEDGPTHQPVEQLTMFRSMPHVNVYRPADAKEMTAALIKTVNSKENPTVIVSSRQNLPVLENTSEEGVLHGGYIAYEPSSTPTGIFVTCGSELTLCIDVAKKLEKEGEYVRVVSMPSMNVFNEQSAEYKEMVLPSNITKRMAVEMGSSMPWYRYASVVHGIDVYGSSMPLKHIHEKYGFTVENIYQEYKKI